MLRLYVFLIVCSYSFAYFVPKSEVNLESEQCRDDLTKYWSDLKLGKKWALTVFDSSSKLPSGLADGNVVDLGNYDGCINLKHELSRIHTVRGQYCLVKIDVDVKNFTGEDKQGNARMLMKAGGKSGLTLAICTLDSCSKNDVQSGYNFIWNTIVGAWIPSLGNVNVTVLNHSCSTSTTREEWTPADIIVTIFLCFVAVLVIISTSYDVYIQDKKKKPKHMALIAFSCYSNGLKLISTSHNGEQLSCLHGIRFVSMMWIIFGYKYSSSLLSPLLNFTDVNPWLNQLSNMFVIGAPVSVDSFFVLSGLLVTYNTLLAMETGIKLNIPRYYLHRYLRLTPVLGVMILIQTTIVKFAGSGPYWNVAAQLFSKNCNKYWWSALLYAQNYVNALDMCLEQTWYLSVDMQLFILSPIILFPMFYWKRKALYLIVILILISIFTPFAISWVFKLSGWSSENTDPNYATKYYVPLQTRFGPWLIGAKLGFYFFMRKIGIRNVTLKRRGRIIGWTICLAIMVTVVWAPFIIENHPYNQIGASIFNALHSHLWAWSLCWVIYACTQGYGGIINWFLSLPVFQVLSRLTYSMYIVHATVMIVKLAQIRTTENFSQFDNLQNYWGDLMITMFFAVLMVLMFESPVIMLEKIIFQPEQKEELPITENNIVTGKKTILNKTQIIKKKIQNRNKRKATKEVADIEDSYKTDIIITRFVPLN